jgi:dihydroorotase
MVRALFIFFAVASAAVAQPAYDVLLKGGRVIDPKNNFDAIADVAVAGGKIARVAANISPESARQTIDATGLYVTPGLIDIHAHMWNRPGAGRPGRNLSVHPDEYSFRTGVTTMVEPGTAGWQDFDDVRARVVNRSRTRVLVMLNILRSGMGTGKENDPAEMDPEGAAKVAKANADVIVGFKTAHYEPADWHAVDNLVKAGNLANLPVMVDFGRVSGDKNIQKLLLEKLRPGDIYTHCYSGLRGELVDGKLNPVMLAARKRGVFFDLGHGGGSFFWNIAIPLAEQGFRPDSISTDMHHGSINAGMKDMLNVLSKMLVLGIPVADLIRMTTASPAAEIRRPQLGNLDVGAEADVAVLKLEQGQFGFIDSAGARNDGTRRLVCELTLRAGRVAWDLNGRAGGHWKSFDYRRRSRSR